MYPEIVPLGSKLELVQNSGIQFVDYDILLDWKTKDKQSMISAMERGYFVRAAIGADEPLVRLVPSFNEGLLFTEPINNCVTDQTTQSYIDVPVKDSLKLYDGVWFPLPYLPDFSNGIVGPINWARARLVQVTDNEAINEAKLRYPQYKNIENEHLSYFRITLAFDTATQENSSETSGYFSPTENDVESGITFSLAYSADRCQSFVRQQWIGDWAKGIFNDLYKERLKPRASQEDLEEGIQTRTYEAHYLNVLAFLGLLVKPAMVHFIGGNTRGNHSATTETVDVSLILDIGNSRSCGMMVEDHPNITREDDNFSDTYVLKIRDLNAPERVYDKPFASRIEFSRPEFGDNSCSLRSGRNDAFDWPSLVRVGDEAAILSAHNEGTEGISGLTSPKRYLWNTDALANGQWQFNNYSYQVNSKVLSERRLQQKSKRAYLSGVCRYCNSLGNALFALKAEDDDKSCMNSRYAYRSTMTFMIIEVLLQAMSQMNSVAQRSQCTSKNVPRRLKAVILTTPPAMASEEKELYRSCVYEAIGILWKSLGFDDPLQPRDKFDFSKDGQYYKEINPPVPEVHMDWNEAEAGQIVYVYNESQKTCKGNSETFLKQLRRKTVVNRIGERKTDKEGHPVISARIASIDIGGGTTDVVIKDYALRSDVKDFSADILPHEVLRDGARIAGDDLVHDLIRSEIITAFAATLRQHMKISTSSLSYGSSPKAVLQDLVGDASTGIIKEMHQSQFTQQILVKIAYRILFHLEHLDAYGSNCIVTGTIRDFLESKEVNPNLDSLVERMPAYDMPMPQVEKFVNDIMGHYIPGFSILDFPLSINISKIHQDIVSSQRFDICRILDKFSEVVGTFKCDLLLLTGRSSRLPCIHDFFMQRLNLPSARIIPMHQYRCSSWYPFSPDGEHIGDPKTTAAVGALISYLRLSHEKLPNFRFNSYPETACSNAHYVGIIDNSNKISDDHVLYTYEPSKRRAFKADDYDEESQFFPYHGDDEEFETQLSVELGFRLLDDPNFEATPFYKIEAYRSINEMKVVRDADMLTWTDTTPEAVQQFLAKLAPEIGQEVRDDVQTLLEKQAALEPYLQEQRNRLEQQLDQAVEAEAAAQVPEPKGLRSLFGSAKEEAAAKRQALAAQLHAERYGEEVEAAFASIEKQARNDVTLALENLLDEAISKNRDVIRKRMSEKHERLHHLLNEKRDQFKVTLQLINKRSPYPVAFIKASKPELPKVETFALEKVYSASDGADYTQFFKMYLKTISGARVRYFMDSGNIDLNGIN